VNQTALTAIGSGQDVMKFQMPMSKKNQRSLLTLFNRAKSCIVAGFRIIIYHVKSVAKLCLLTPNKAWLPPNKK